MAKPKKEQTNSEENQVETQAPLTHVGLGIFQNPTDKMWYVAELKFNPQTYEAKVVKEYLAGEDKYFAAEALKLKIVELELV